MHFEIKNARYIPGNLNSFQEWGPASKAEDYP